MDAKKPVFIPVGEGKSVPLDLLLDALEEEVGTELGRISIAPELAEHFAQFTEDPSWKNLPTEVTSIKRTDEEAWEVRVGEFSGSFTREELQQQVKQALGGESENQS